MMLLPTINDTDIEVGWLLLLSHSLKAHCLQSASRRLRASLLSFVSAGRIRIRSNAECLLVRLAILRTRSCQCRQILQFLSSYQTYLCGVHPYRPVDALNS